MKRKMDAVVARAPPKLIGAYEKHQEIGRGTYGTVYAGVRSSSADSNGTEAPAERVAIKKVLGRVDAGRREAAFLERCRDARHIVQVRIALASAYTYGYVSMQLSDAGTCVCVCVFDCYDRSWTRWSATTSCT